MIRLVLMLVCLGIGFGGGVYWGVKHPADAQKLASVEEKQFIEKQKVLLEKMKRKLDELSSAQPTGGTGATGTGTSSTGGRSGFLGAAPAGATRKDPELEELKKESDQQLQQANKLLQDGK
jgi:hypothetical protein